ncbi:MAG TPA: winged helix DNA-binding domain-containing protein [Streptosporangiaceae bacterium]|jgi:hypothetical protein
MATQTLDPARLSRATMARQLLLERAALSPAEAISALCAVQAHEPRPPYLALWNRLAGFGEADLRAATGDGSVLRVTLMRATLHLVTAADYPAIRGPLQPALCEVFTGLRERAAGIELEQILPAAREAYASGPLTFDALRARLAAQFPGLDERVTGYAVRTNLPLAMVPSADRWGYPRVAEFGLTSPFGTDTDPGSLVLRYLAAFGPASAADAQSFLGLRRLGPVLDKLAPGLVTFADQRGRTLYDLPDAPRPAADVSAPVRFLPDFDNLVLGYADRSRFLAEEFKGQVTTRNLRVRATFLHDGVIRGTWSTKKTARAATLTITPFEPLAQKTIAELEPEAGALLRFAEPGLASYHVTVASPG